MNNNTIKEILELIKNSQYIAITGHIRPDGDCYGSVLGFYNYIRDNKKSFKKVKECDLFLKSNEVADEFYNASLLKQANMFTVRNYDLLICFDASATDRIENYSLLEGHSEVVLNIDHHRTNTYYGDYNYVRELSSVCEVLFDFFEEEKISSVVAKCLYYGILTDTGGFRFSMTTRRTMELAGLCMEIGHLDTEGIINRAFNVKTPEFNKLLGMALINTEYYALPTIPDCPVNNNAIAYVFIDKDMLKSLGYLKPEYARIENIPAILKSTLDCIVSVTVVELSDNKFRISLRCHKKLDVAAIAEEFNGGGHTAAAGLDLKVDKKKPKQRQLAEFIDFIGKRILEQIEEKNLTWADFV